MSEPLSPTDRHRLAALAVRVIEAEPGERESLIAAATTDRPDLREALRKLLEESSSELTGDPLEDLAEVFKLAAADAEDSDSFDQSGTTIDRYTLIRRIGAGAYGAVYLAEQTSPVTRQVAIKLLHPGVGSPRVIRRFALERRVLASLDHPGVARLIDAGSAPDGRPYLVMDLIDGVNALDYCREHDLSVHERVRLLSRACDAVQHAHGRGVVHRDLKPGNILVRSVDGEPQPVIIDFGVARLLDPDPELALTSLGHPIGTRRYMSPEQRSGKVVDARTDIYCLGVTLAEVLTESAPRESEGDAPEGRAQPFESLVKGLPRELGWIASRCCQEDPADRYQAAAELGADLRRFIAGEAVRAAPPSALYQCGRFLARHPAPTLLSLIALAVIVGFAVYAQVSSVRLAREVEAQRRLITATIDDVIDDIWVFMGSESARENLIGRLLERTEELLQGSPDDVDLLEAKARLLRSMDYFYRDRSDFESASRVCREALDIYERLSSGREGDVEFLRAHAEAVVRMGDAVSIGSPSRNENRDTVSAFYGRALDMQLAALAHHPGHIGLRDDIYWSYNRVSYSLPADRAWGHLREALQTAQDLFADSPDRLLSHFALTKAHLSCGEFLLQATPHRDLASARPYLEKALHGAREIVATQPNRSAFVFEHGNALKALMALHRAQSQPEGLAELAEELEAALLSSAVPHLGRLDMQQFAAFGLLELARTYTFLDRHDDARNSAQRLSQLSTNTEISLSPRVRNDLDRAIASLRNEGILPGVGYGGTDQPE